MSSILWTLGLTLCGALRTILLWEHSEIALLAAISTITTLSHEKVWLSSTPFLSQGWNVITVTMYHELHFQGRGAVFLILGICSMLLFDNDQSKIPSEHRKLMYILYIVEFRHCLFVFSGKNLMLVEWLPKFWFLEVSFPPPLVMSDGFGFRGMHVMLLLISCTMFSVTYCAAEGPHRSVVAHSLYQSLSLLGVPDHKVCWHGC